MQRAKRNHVHTPPQDPGWLSAAPRGREREMSAFGHGRGNSFATLAHVCASGRQSPRMRIGVRRNKGIAAFGEKSRQWGRSSLSRCQKSPATLSL